MPHPPPVPIDAVSGIVVGGRTFREIEQRSRVAGKDSFHVLERRRVAEAANFIAERPQRFRRDLAHAQRPAVAQFPDPRASDRS